MTPPDTARVLQELVEMLRVEPCGLDGYMRLFPPHDGLLVEEAWAKPLAALLARARALLAKDSTYAK